eukprot:782793-Alexandrium_andersonii.AAC.1
MRAQSEQSGAVQRESATAAGADSTRSARDPHAGQSPHARPICADWNLHVQRQLRLRAKKDFRARPRPEQQQSELVGRSRLNWDLYIA